MTLNAYLEAKHDTQAELARRCGVSAASISRIRTAKQVPSFALASRIVAETKGKVTFADLPQKVAA